MKKTTVLIGLTLLLSTTGELLANPANAKSKSRNNNNNRNFDNQSGYNTDVHVIDHENRHIIKRFTPRDLNPYLSVLNRLRAVAFFEK